VEDEVWRMRCGGWALQNPGACPSPLTYMRVDAPLPLLSISRPSFKTQPLDPSIRMPHQLITLPVEVLEKILGLVSPQTSIFLYLFLTYL
jgi:hypothetical protein